MRPNTTIFLNVSKIRMWIDILVPGRIQQNTTIFLFDKNFKSVWGARQNKAKYYNNCKRLIDKKSLALLVCAQDTTIYYNICKGCSRVIYVMDTNVSLINVFNGYERRGDKCLQWIRMSR